MNSYLDMDDNFDEFNRNFNRSNRRNIRRKSRRRKRKPLYRREKITMYDYLASSVPADASFVINKFGRFEKPRDEKELAQQLKSFVRMYGDKAINELAKIHPDKKLLEANCEKCENTKMEKMNRPEPNYQEFLNANGNAGQDRFDRETQTARLTTNMLVIGGFMVMAFALISKR